MLPCLVFKMWNIINTIYNYTRYDPNKLEMDARRTLLGISHKGSSMGDYSWATEAGSSYRGRLSSGSSLWAKLPTNSADGFPPLGCGMFRSSKYIPGWRVVDKLSLVFDAPARRRLRRCIRNHIIPAMISPPPTPPTTPPAIAPLSVDDDVEDAEDVDDSKDEDADVVGVDVSEDSDTDEAAEEVVVGTFPNFLLVYMQVRE